MLVGSKFCNLGVCTRDKTLKPAKKPQSSYTLQALEAAFNAEDPIKIRNWKITKQGGVAQLGRAAAF